MPFMMPSSMAFSSPDGRQMTPSSVDGTSSFTHSPGDGPPKRPMSSSSSSVNMSCMSPDGRAVHSLSVSSSGSCIVETHTLPLAGTVEFQDDESTMLRSDKPSVIRTRLPHRVATALQRCPAVELLCLDVDSTPSSTHTESIDQFGSPLLGGRAKKQSINLPSLCLYTATEVFLFDISYEATPGVAEVDGTVYSLQEPYEQFLIDNPSCSIVRIRQAPQKHKGYATMCPPGAMAMLTMDRHNGEYCLCLYHGKAGSTAGSVQLTVHYFPKEELDDPSERIIDFCFCQSSTLSLLSSLTVVFLKGSANVFFASPILFRGTVVPSPTITNTLEFLDASIQEEKGKTAQWRQYRTAKQFLIDAFPDNGRSNFVITGSATHSAALEWPIQLQGPLFLTPVVDDDYESLITAATIEPFCSGGELSCFCIGYHGDVVDFCVASPSVFVPRFTLEPQEDTYNLDEDLARGVTVNRVSLRTVDEDTFVRGASSSYGAPVHKSKSIQLIPDPIMDTVIHYVSPTSVVSISSNVTRVASNHARERARQYGSSSSSGRDGTLFSPPSKRSDLQPKTTAWVCLDVAFIDDVQNPLVGAVVSCDVQLGHVLVTRLASGQMVAVNLTETRHLREMESLAGDSPTRPLAIEDGTASDTERLLTQSLRETEPLLDIVQPLIEKVHHGISKMAQLGGSSTPYSEITPNVLAGAVAIGTQCEKEVLLPLVEMNEHVSARRSELTAMYQNQIQQMKALQAMILKLRERSGAIEEKSETVKLNAQSLAQRSASVLQSTTDLLPTITEAEYSYFEQLKRMESKLAEWENEVERLKIKVSTLSDVFKLGSAGCPMKISQEELINYKKVLRASEKHIQKYSTKLGSVEGRIFEVAKVVGLVSKSEKPVLSIQ
jgi:hypothetical protein